MSPQTGPKIQPSEPCKDTAREMREAVIEDAEKTEGAHRDLEHGDGGTLGLINPDDLDHDD